MELLDKDIIDTQRLYDDMSLFLSRNDFWDRRQISLTSVTGDNDWTSSIGRVAKLGNSERLYRAINKDIEGSYMAELIQQYKQYFRWRLLLVPCNTTYTIHTDNFHVGTNKVNKRIHIPICTNPGSYFCYYGAKAGDGVETTVKFHHLPIGSTYEVNADSFHTAVNFGDTPRYHMVGVRYE